MVIFFRKCRSLEWCWDSVVRMCNNSVGVRRTAPVRCSHHRCRAIARLRLCRRLHVVVVATQVGHGQKGDAQPENQSRDVHENNQ